MATVKDVARLAEKLYPPQNVCMQDYIGLSVGDFDSRVTKALVCLDCTLNIVEEAAATGAQMIISHHPLIFGSIGRVTADDPIGRTILLAAKYGISVYSAHTNMDCTKGGINDFVAKALGLKHAEPLVEVNENAALGRVGELEKPISLREYAKFVAEKLSDRHVKVYGEDKAVKKAAVINGAGGDVETVIAAKKKGADVLVTGEIKHHVALYARFEGISIIEVGHYASERIYIPRLTELLSAEAKKNDLEIQFTAAESESDPAL
ncbi:MAG: Nif3-like dinuclear metal center hexameric protein [Candidatus Neoclostridium sp.]